MSKRGRRGDDAIAELEAIYAEIPDMANCKGLCHDSCSTIRMSPLEAQRTGHPNDGKMTMRCPKLTPMNLCSVYDKRPFVCRLFGTFDRLRCDHGCVPTRWLTQEEVLNLQRRIDRVGGVAPQGFDPGSQLALKHVVGLMMKGQF